MGKIFEYKLKKKRNKIARREKTFNPRQEKELIKKRKGEKMKRASKTLLIKLLGKGTTQNVRAKKKVKFKKDDIPNIRRFLGIDTTNDLKKNWKFLN